MIVFIIEILFIGFEYSATFLTLWLYIENIVKPKSPKVYYSAISGSYLLGSLLFSMFLGKIVGYISLRTNCMFCLQLNAYSW